MKINASKGIAGIVGIAMLLVFFYLMVQSCTKL